MTEPLLGILGRMGPHCGFKKVQYVHYKIYNKYTEKFSKHEEFLIFKPREVGNRISITIIK